MSEYQENPLYQEVLANPYDLEPRFVFADWLEEHGDQRCDVIRMQFRLENMTPGERGYSTLKTKARKLFKRVGGFGSVRGITSCKEEYRAGFVDRIELTPTRFRDHAAKLFSIAPLRRVRLKGVCKSFDKIASLTQLTQVCEVELKSTQIDDRNFRALAHSPFLTGLQSFSVHSDELTSAGRDIAQSTLLDNLESLLVSGRLIDDKSTAYIAEHAVSLKKLALRSRLSDESLYSIAKAPGLSSLNSLEIGTPWGSQAEFNEKALRHFAESSPGESPAAQPLRGFAIRGVQPGFARAFDGPRFSKLEELTVGSTRISDADFEAILNRLNNLNYMDCTYTNLGDGAMRLLADNPLLANLQKLYLSGNRISKKGVDSILASKHFNKSTKFYFNGNALKANEIDAIKERAGKTFGNFSRDSSYWYYG
jgi:uncharacterized protein (TIGR02996 family)